MVPCQPRQLVILSLPFAALVAFFWYKRRKSSSHSDPGGTPKVAALKPVDSSTVASPNVESKNVVCNGATFPITEEPEVVRVVCKDSENQPSSPENFEDCHVFHSTVIEDEDFNRTESEDEETVQDIVERDSSVEEEVIEKTLEHCGAQEIESIDQVQESLIEDKIVEEDRDQELEVPLAEQSTVENVALKAVTDVKLESISSEEKSSINQTVKSDLIVEDNLSAIIELSENKGDVSAETSVDTGLGSQELSTVEVEESDTTMALGQNTEEAKNAESATAGLERKLATLGLDTQTPVQRTERDSANHSPAEVMLNSPAISTFSDAHSEGSSDSGKGCSDVVTPPSRTPAGGSSVAGDQVPIIYEFVLPQVIVGRLIGRHGAFLHDIRSKTHTNVFIKRHPETNTLKICAIEGECRPFDSVFHYSPPASIHMLRRFCHARKLELLDWNASQELCNVSLDVLHRQPVLSLQLSLQLEEQIKFTQSQVRAVKKPGYNGGLDLGLVVGNDEEHVTGDIVVVELKGFFNFRRNTDYPAFQSLEYLQVKGCDGSLSLRCIPPEPHTQLGFALQIQRALHRAVTQMKKRLSAKTRLLPLLLLGPHSSQCRVTGSRAVQVSPVTADTWAPPPARQQGLLLAGLYLPVKRNTRHSKNRYVTLIWAALWMSRNGTSLTANIEILECKGSSIGLVYCGRKSRIVHCHVCTGTQPDIDAALKMIRQKFPLRRFPELTLEKVTFVKNSCLPINPENLQLHLVEGVNNDVLLSSLITAGHFFLQMPMHISYQSLYRLACIMNNVYNTQESPPLPDPQPDVVCVAPAHGGWYRAQILSVDEEAHTSHIKFLDYGGFLTVENSSLRQIRGDFLLLPFQAVECVLANVVPAGGGEEWSDEATQFVQLITGQQTLQAQVYEYTESGMPLIYLYCTQFYQSPSDPSGYETQVVLLNQELVSRGYAELIVDTSQDDDGQTTATESS
ncbi:protein kinase A regulatory subunit binding [Homalodisca vitripennis]|nr:protein kinase A regulatory subunit binding [Homalodisca vitripennis]